MKALDLAMTKEGGPARSDRRSEMGPVVDAFDRLKRLREELRAG